MIKIFINIALKRLFMLYLTVISLNGFAQSNYEITSVALNFIPSEKTKKEVRKTKKNEFSDNSFRIIQFYSIPSDADRKQWESEGLFLCDYFPKNAYFAVIKDEFKLKKLNDKVRSIIVLDSKLKQDLDLQHFAGMKENAAKNVTFIISYFPHLSFDEIVSDLKSKNLTITAHRKYSRQIEINCSIDKIEVITDLPYVQFVGKVEESYELEDFNYSGRNSTGGSNQLNTGNNGILYNGSGITIGVGESGSVGNSIEFKGRLNDLENIEVESSHKIGSSENGCGAGNFDPTNRNNGWGSNIISFNSQPYENLIDTYNCRYFNHSFGVGIQGGYNSLARNHDLRTVAYPNHLVSYSSGNDGTEAGYAPYDAIPGWANLTGSMKQNKNHLVVANLDKEGNPLNWGCTGPSYDGRIIPQLRLEGSEGTSFASPKAVGIFALLEEAYKTTHSGVESNSTLMKGIILNTADDLGNPGPDFRNGYGQPNAGNAYTVIANNQFILDNVSQGDTNSHAVMVPPNVKQIKAMLIWQDVAASVNANPAIVNDLDFLAYDANNTSLEPWVLDHTPLLNSISAEATRKRDSINTVEQITFDMPSTGLWNFNVIGQSVPFGPQNYFITYSYIYDSLKMTYPLSNEKLISGDQYLLKWESYDKENVTNLSYRINGGNWLSVATSLPGTQKKYTFTAPFLSGIGTIEFKISQGSKSFTGNINYIGKQPESFHIVKSCSDTVELKWSALPNATSYKVYRLGTKYMEEVTSNITITGTTAVLTLQNPMASEYYAVSAVTGAFEGQRTLTIERAVGDFGCTSLDWIGIISTDWFNAGNWGNNLIPTEFDNVRIPSTAPFQPIINNSGANCENITILNGASLGMNNTTPYTLNVWGDWINHGAFNAGMGTIQFSDTISYQEVTGSSTTNFYKIIVAKKSVNNILEIKSIISIIAPSNNLTLTAGTFKLSSNSLLTISSNLAFNSKKQLWNNGGTITFGNFSWFLDAGRIKNSAGTLNLGTNSNNSITYLNNGQFTMEGGTVVMASRFVPNSGVSSGTFAIHNGELILNQFGSTSTTSPLLRLNPNANFQMSGGKITIKNASSNTTDDISIASLSSNVSGGILQIGNSSTSAAQVVRINSNVPLYDVTIDGANNPVCQLVNNNLFIKNDLKIGTGVLQSNNKNITIQGDFYNNGNYQYAGISDTVKFLGGVRQNIFGNNPITFNNIELANTNGLSLSASQNVQVDGLLKLTNGVIYTNSNSINALGNVSRIEGHVYGNLSKPFTTVVLNRSFEVGDSLSTDYTPLDMTFTAITTPGIISVKAVNSDHPNLGSSILNAGKSVNRYWKIVNNSINFTSLNVAGEFLSSDLDPNVSTSLLVGGIFDGTNWSYPTVATVMMNSVSVNNSNSIGDFALAMDCENNASTSTISACSSYLWDASNETYTNSGVYTQTLTNTAGCDSTLTLNLTINTPTTSLITASSCNTYSLNGQTYTNSGVYTQNLTNTAGCDSTLTLNLTINTPTTSLITASSCNTYSLNGQTYTNSGVYTQTLINTAGCDSTLTLNLTINTPTTSLITASSCNTYSLNGQTYTNSGVYTQNLTNAAGCDSTLTLNLTINDEIMPVVTYLGSGILNAVGNGTTFQWLDCLTSEIIPNEINPTFIAENNGSYAVILGNGNCQDTSECFNIGDLKIVELSINNLLIYPNPATEGITVKSSLDDIKSISIKELNGKLIHREQLNSKLFELNINTIVPGVYFIEIETVNQLITDKFIKK